MQDTPPHYPTYGVQLAESVLRAIVELVFPGREFGDAVQLTSGKSFNNRVYFLSVGPNPGDIQNQYVIKVSGHFFGTRKLQNEVGALTLLNRFCPDVPVPRLVAWSETGSSIQTVDGRVQETLSSAFSKHGWILMTRLPGRGLEISDITEPSGAGVLRYLAKCMARWRLSIPSLQSIGHLRFLEPSDSQDAIRFDGPFSEAPSFTLGGLILTHKYDPTPLSGPLEYFMYQLEDQYDHLIHASELSLLSEKISNQVSELIASLPGLSWLSEDTLEGEARTQGRDLKDTGNANFVFSHMDFSPRNILVMPSSDGQTLKVTGIIDFEFSAFLPHPEEFLNTIVHQPDDWPVNHYEAFLSHLAQFGVETPTLLGESPEVNHKQKVLLRSANFKKLRLLETIIGNVAPWWMTPQWHKQQSASDVVVAIEKVADIVLRSIEELRHTDS